MELPPAYVRWDLIPGTRGEGLETCEEVAAVPGYDQTNLNKGDETLISVARYFSIPDTSLSIRSHHTSYPGNPLAVSELILIFPQTISANNRF